MPNHPEVPKDHPRFEIFEGKYLFYVTGHGVREISELMTLERQDCAAHAAAYWFEKSQQICDSEDGDPIDMLKATKIALAWLAWGKGE